MTEKQATDVIINKAIDQDITYRRRYLSDGIVFISFTRVDDGKTFSAQDKNPYEAATLAYAGVTTIK